MSHEPTVDFELRVIEFHTPKGKISVTVPNHWTPSMIEQYAKFIGDAINYDLWPESLKR